MSGPTGVRLRPIRGEDAHALYGVFRRALEALVRTYGDEWAYDPVEDAASWPRWASLYAHLQASCDHAWLAERDGAVVGYARSLRRGDTRELTEFFVLPEVAGGGVGKRLLEAAFPREAGVARVIVATGDTSAQSRYIRHGFRGHTPLLELRGRPARDALPTDLAALPLDLDDPAQLDALAAVDREVLGLRRDDAQRWYATARTGLRFLRGDRVVGYGWVGPWSGPVAALDPDDLPAMLSLLDAAASDAGIEELAWNVPGLAQAAAAHLLERGYRLDRMPVLLMSDGATLPGAFDRYVVTTPPFFL
jgi:GNAT superfamily N-acetyltransferase